jgi:hypothetical protein
MCENVFNQMDSFDKFVCIKFICIFYRTFYDDYRSNGLGWPDFHIFEHSRNLCPAQIPQEAID